jgi:hypothetical protein
MGACDTLENWKKFTAQNRFKATQDLIDQYAKEHGLDDVNVVNQNPPDLPGTDKDESKSSGAYDPDTRTIYLNPGLFTNDGDGSTPDRAFETAGHEIVHAEARDTFPGDPWLDSDEGHDLLEETSDAFGDAVGKDLQAQCKRPPPAQSPAAEDSIGDEDLGDEDSDDDEGGGDNRGRPPRKGTQAPRDGGTP